MKKILSLVLVLVFALTCFAACGGDDNDGTNNEKDYTLALAVESTESDGKITNYVAALVLDKDNKIVAARIDCVETTLTVTDDAITDVASVATKVELGDNYAMESGSFANQTKAFENAIVGKTADEVKNLDLSLVTGCTMPYSPFSFKTVIAKAFASTNKATFKTASAITVGVAANMKVSGSKASADFAGVVMVGDKIAAVILDSNEYTATVADGEITVGAYNGTKVELGDNYAMESGSFAKQTDAFENYVIGKTEAEIATLDFTLITGCTMPYTPYSFQAVLVEVIGYAR